MTTSRQKSVGSNKTKTELLQEIEELKNSVKQSNSQAVVIAEEQEHLRVTLDDYIETVSLCPMQLVLTTEPKGRGFSYTWNKYGESMLIVYSDLQNLIKNHGNGLYTDFIRKGYVYINNPSVVKKSGLSEIYKQLLNKEQMDIALRCDSQKGVDLFKSTIRTQQMFIVDMIIDKMARGGSVDLNFLFQLSQIVGTNIGEHAEEAKSYLAMNLKRE